MASNQEVASNDSIDVEDCAHQTELSSVPSSPVSSTSTCIDQENNYKVNNS